MSDATLTKGLSAPGMRVGGWFIWKDIKSDGIEVDLLDAHVGTLMDQPGSWQPVKRLLLSYFRYDRIESEMDVEERLDWLAQHDNTVSRFTPQPYLQLANVWRQNGFAGEAAQVLIRREDKQRADEWNRAITSMDGTLARELIGYAHVLRPFLSLPFKWIFGYGHQPACALLWVAGLVAIATWFSHETYIRGQFAATSPVVLTSKEWLDRFPSAALPADSPGWKAQLEDWTRPPPGATMRPFAPGSMRWTCLSRWMLWGSKKHGPLGIARLVGRGRPPAALACANVWLGDCRHRRGRGNGVDRSAGLTFRALRVMGGAC